MTRQYSTYVSLSLLMSKLDIDSAWRRRAPEPLTTKQEPMPVACPRAYAARGVAVPGAALVNQSPQSETQKHEHVQRTPDWPRLVVVIGLSRTGRPASGGWLFADHRRLVRCSAECTTGCPGYPYTSGSAVRTRHRRGADSCRSVLRT